MVQSSRDTPTWWSSVSISCQHTHCLESKRSCSLFPWRRALPEDGCQVHVCSTRQRKLQVGSRKNWRRGSWRRWWTGKLQRLLGESLRKWDYQHEHINFKTHFFSLLERVTRLRRVSLRAAFVVEKEEACLRFRMKGSCFCMVTYFNAIPLL